MHSLLSEYVTKDVADTAFDFKSVMDRNATTLFLTELFRGTSPISLPLLLLSP